MKQSSSHTPLIRRSLLRRVSKSIAVLLSGISLLSLGFTLWALDSGRAADSVRKSMLTILRDRCEVNAEFGAITVDPFRRQVQVFDVKMHQLHGGELILAVQQAQFSLRLLPLFYGSYQLKSVAFLAPEATIRIADGKILNLPVCLQTDSDASLKPIALGINELNVERGSFDLIVDGLGSAQLRDIGLSLTSGSAGGMDLAVGVDDGIIVSGGRTLPLHRLRLLGHVEGLLARPRALNFKNIELSLADIEAQLSGSIDLLGPVYEAKVKATFPLSALQDFVEDSPEVTGQAALELSVSGTSLLPRAVGQVELTKARVAGFGLGDSAKVTISADMSGLQMSRIDIDLGKGHLSGKGKLGFEETLPFEIEIQVHKLSLAKVLDAVTVPGSWADLTATKGGADLKGILNPLQLHGAMEFAVKDFVVFDQGWDSPLIAGRPWPEVPVKHHMLVLETLNLRSQWHLDDRSISFSDGRFTTGASRGAIDARITYAEGLKVEAHIPVFDGVDMGPVAGLRFGGFGSMSGVVSGPWENISGVGTFELEDLTIGGVPFGRGHGNVDWHDLIAIDVSGVEGRLGDTRYDAQVGILLEGEIPMSITGSIHSGRVEDMFLPFRLDGRDWGDPQGDFVGRFDLIGPIDRLTGPIEGEFKNLVVVQERAEKGRFIGRMDEGRLVAESVELTKHGSRLQGSGYYDINTGAVRMRARTLKATLQDFDVLNESLPLFDGAVDFELALDGKMGSVTGTASARFKDVRAGAFGMGSGQISGPVADGRVKLTGKVGNITLDNSDILLSSMMPYTATLTMEQTDAPAIFAGLQGHQDYQGRVSGQGDFYGSLVDWARSSGVLKLSSAKVSAQGLAIETAAKAKFGLKDGVLSTRRLVLKGPRSRIVAEGAMGAKSIDLHLFGRVDLALFELTSPSVEKAGGVIAVDATVTGPPDGTNIVGTGRVEGGLLQLAGFDDRVTNFSGELTFSRTSVLIEHSEGRWAGGKFGITGSMQMDTFVPTAVALSIAVEDARPGFSYDFGDIGGSISGVVNWTGPWTRSQITGKLNVVDGLVSPKLDWRALGQRQLAAAYDPSAEVMDFDLLFHAKDPIRLKNDEVDLEVTGDVRLTGTNERFGMLGTLNLVQGGRVSLLGRQYTMESGVVEFRERYSFQSRFDMVLSAQACAARITLNAIGAFDVDDVETIYSSSPQMDQRDIVSCLMRGVKVSDLDQDLASFAGSALLKLSGVDREVKKVLPIDQLDVTTEYSSLSRSYEPRVVIGKDLAFLDRPTRLEYSTSLLRSNDQRAALKMRLTPRLNLQLGWTSSEDVPFGDWGLDLRQRWEW